MWFRPCIFKNEINVIEMIPNSVLQEKLSRSSLTSQLNAVKRWGWRLDIHGEEEEEGWKFAGPSWQGGLYQLSLHDADPKEKLRGKLLALTRMKCV